MAAADLEPVRLGVLGLGRMGRHHVRCAGLARGVELVAAGDVRAECGEDLPVPFSTDPDFVLEKCEAVVLAVPTDRHLEVGRRVLAAGRHLLVEKPLADSEEACRALAEAAAEASRTLAVGHVERWNGAWEVCREALGTPRFAEADRLAAFDPRGTEVDVVLDLMIHDLDLALCAFGAEPERVDAIGVAVLTERVDIAHARLEFPGGGLANLNASRVSPEPVRKLRLFQDDGYLSLDLRTQEAELLSRDAAAPHDVGRRHTAAPEGHNPLVRELEEFARAVRGEAHGSIGAEEATRAVRVARRVLDSIAERRAAWAGSPV